MDPREGTIIISEQVRTLLERLDATVYSTSLPIFNGSSVGQHVRHIIDFYICLLHGVESSAINYDQRERNPTIETDPMTARNIMLSIAQQVEMLSVLQAVEVQSSFVADSDVELKAIPSSIGRELMYAYDHAIHHLAIIKIGLQVHYPNIELDPDLGVAPSTLKYRKQCAQ